VEIVLCEVDVTAEAATGHRRHEAIRSKMHIPPPRPEHAG